LVVLLYFLLEVLFAYDVMKHYLKLSGPDIAIIHVSVVLMGRGLSKMSADGHLPMIMGERLSPFPLAS